jgi:hypothetical protein
MLSSCTASALRSIVLLTWLATPLHAQGSIGMRVGAARFSGGAEEPATGRSLLPYRPTTFEAGASRVHGRFGVGLRVHYASSSLALEGNDALSAVKDVMKVYGIAPELSVRLSGLGPQAVLRAYAGPVFEIWKLDENTSHSRLGAAAALGLEVPFGGRWSGAARVGGAVMRSPFDEEDLIVGLEPRTLWRRELSAGLNYRM